VTISPFLIDLSVVFLFLSFWKTKPSKERKLYDRESLKRAFKATLSGMSVYRASRVYSVPESTLRDHTGQIVKLNQGLKDFSPMKKKSSLLTVLFIWPVFMDTQLVTFNSDYARPIDKKVQAKEGLSQGLFYAFLGRWDKLTKNWGRQGQNVHPEKLYPNTFLN
jgi:hypothetical protein